MESYGEKSVGGLSGVSPVVSPNRRDLPRGSLYRHSKTRGYYLKIRWPGETKISYIPLTPAGKKYATKQKGIALVIARRLLHHRLKDAANLPAASKGLDSWITLFERRCALSVRSDRSVQPQSNASVCRKFAAIQQITRPVDITADDIEEYLLWLKSVGRSRKTLVNHRGTLSKFCTFLIRQGQLDSDPFDLLEPIHAPTRPPRRVPDKTVADLLAAAERAGNLYAEIMVAVHCGLRLGEIWRLRWGDIEVGPKGWTLIVGSREPTKSDSWRAVPIPAVLRTVLDRMRGGSTDQRIFAQRSKMTWIRQFKRLSEGLPVFGNGKQWHVLRSYCAIQKAKAGMTVPQLMYEMGWTSMSMAQRYINIAQAAGVAAKAQPIALHHPEAK